MQSLINIPGKDGATLCESHVFVTLDTIIHYSSVSDGATPASDQFGGSKADMLGYNCINVGGKVCSPSYYMYDTIV